MRRHERLRWPILGVMLIGCAVAACSPARSGPDAASTAVDASSRASTTPAPSTTAARLAGESDGGYVFRTQCAGCHGTKGEGNVGPPLAGIDKTLTLEAETDIVRNGKSRMPPFSPALSDAEIAAVVEYTRAELK